MKNSDVDAKLYCWEDIPVERQQETQQIVDEFGEKWIGQGGVTAVTANNNTSIGVHLVVYTLDMAASTSIIPTSYKKLPVDVRQGSSGFF